VSLDAQLAIVTDGLIVGTTHWLGGWIRIGYQRARIGRHRRPARARRGLVVVRLRHDAGERDRLTRCLQPPTEVPVLHFYDVEGVLVRRWVPGQRRLAMEGWNGVGWAPYPNVDDVARRGIRLSEVEALGLLRESHRRSGTLPTLSDAEARAKLSARLLRA
jgi:hypothetical protein